jgi:hypothetical protein
MKHKCDFCKKGNLYFVTNSTEGDYPNIYAVAGIYACDKCGKVSVLGVKQFKIENEIKKRNIEMYNRINEERKKEDEFIKNGFCRCGVDLTRQKNPFGKYFLRMVCLWCNKPRYKCTCETTILKRQRKSL